ncbi:MAG TPA: ABC transporter permease [Williamwhitmania sp.]|nr:ABC transporter permease [Williamwhitmania sp.]
MVTYLLRRISSSIAILFGVVTLLFMLFSLVPGDASRMLAGQRSDKKSIELIRKDLGLDQPKMVQYLGFLNDLSPVSFHSANPTSFFFFDTTKYGKWHGFRVGRTIVAFKAPYLRRSYQSQKPVSEIIGETLPNTLVLAFTSMLFASVLGIFLGLVCGLKKDSWFDRSALVITSFGMSLPSFFAAILIAWLFAFKLHHLTGLPLTGNLWEIDDLGNGPFLRLQNLILPSLTLGIRPLSVVTQLTRSSILDVLSQDYIRTAKAKGLSTWNVIYRHGLKNSLNPVITGISGWFASMMAGVIFVEYIFGWKGLGYVVVDALNSYDMPVVAGCVLTISIIFIVVNLMVDFAYTLIDPRVELR